MPKKTKKEKIIAKYRRKYRLIKQQINHSPNKFKQEKEKPSTPEIIEKKPSLKTPSSDLKINEDSLIKQFFIKDLKKTLLLTGLIISIEVFLYFVNIGYISH